MKRLRRLGRAEWLLLAEALATLALSSAAIRLLPFRKVAAMAGKDGKAAAAPDASAQIVRVRWAVDAWARRVPWRTVCFQRGLTAHLMLRRRGYGSRLHYGVAQSPEEGLSAHVWVTLEGRDVTGGDEAEKFARVATFPSPKA